MAPIKTLADEPHGMVKIAEFVLSSPAVTFDFTSIPATYRALKLVVHGALSAPALAYYIGVRFNNDSGSNYDAVGVDINTGTGYLEQLGTTFARVSEMVGASGPASAGDQIVIDIVGYADTTLQKSFNSHGTGKRGITTGLPFLSIMAGWWRNTAAINRITVADYQGGSNFVTGSIAVLYGLS